MDKSGSTDWKQIILVIDLLGNQYTQILMKVYN